MTHRSTRRTVLLATGAVTLAAGCSKYGDNSGSGSSSVNASGGQELAKTSEIPVGGGKIFKDQKVVVTQPKKDEFKAFSAVCTHQGCTVQDVAGGTINCPCHGSKFSTDGSVVNGPAKQPLPPRQVMVEGNWIRVV